MFFFIWHFIILHWIDHDDDIQLLISGKSHGRTPAFKQDPVPGFILVYFHLFGILIDLKRPALQQVDDIVPVLGKIDRKLRINGIVILFVNRGKQFPHLLHQILFFNDALT